MGLSRSPKANRLHWLVGLLIFCAAFVSEAGTSASPLAQTAPPASGGVVTLAQTQQVDAPALVYSGGQLIAAWIGSDDRGVHQDARRLSVPDLELSETQTLPLPPTHPYDQRLYPGDLGSAHLLWLDADNAQQTTLYSALLAPDLSVERGPVSLSEGLALNFAAVPDGAGGLWTAWSGGQLAELTLYVRRLDADGRPLFDKMILAQNADHPALVRTVDGAVWLFWLAEGQLMRQRIDSDEQTAQALTSTVNLAHGDQLVDVRAALDATHAYFFWNITRANGVSESWWATGTLSESSWQPPIRLTNGVGAPLRWTVPLPDQKQTQIAAVESDAGLGVISLHGGAITGYTTYRSGEHLIGFPALVSDTAGHFMLAWAAPNDLAADLQVMALGN